MPIVVILTAPKDVSKNVQSIQLWLQTQATQLQTQEGAELASITHYTSGGGEEPLTERWIFLLQK